MPFLLLAFSTLTLLASSSIILKIPLQNTPSIPVTFFTQILFSTLCLHSLNISFFSAFSCTFHASSSLFANRSFVWSSCRHFYSHSSLKSCIVFTFFYLNRCINLIYTLPLALFVFMFNFSVCDTTCWPMPSTTNLIYLFATSC